MYMYSEELNHKYNENKYDKCRHILRFAMILFRMFISSFGLTSISYMTNMEHH